MHILVGYEQPVPRYKFQQAAAGPWPGQVCLLPSMPVYSAVRGPLAGRRSRSMVSIPNVVCRSYPKPELRPGSKIVPFVSEWLSRCRLRVWHRLSLRFAARQVDIDNTSVTGSEQSRLQEGFLSRPLVCQDEHCRWRVTVLFAGFNRTISGGSFHRFPECSVVGSRQFSPRPAGPGNVLLWIESNGRKRKWSQHEKNLK